MSLQEHSIVTDGSYVSATSPVVEAGDEEVGMSKNEVDPNRICCNGLFEAELVEGRVVLECLSCGSLWFRQADGTLAVDDSLRTPIGD